MSRARRERRADRRGRGDGGDAAGEAAAQAPELRRDEVIGGDAYRVLVRELDRAELSAGGGRQD